MKKAVLLFLSITFSSFALCQFDYIDEVVPNETAAITLGVLHGGGGIVGLDMEFLISEKIGLQAGIGFLSFGAGMNYHLKSGGIKKSYINFGYWHQGIGNSYVQSMIGPTFGFRARKLLQIQIGLGARIGTGPAYTGPAFGDIDLPILALYSIGFYFPVR